MNSNCSNSLLLRFCSAFMASIHIKCRNTEVPYLRSSVHRLIVPDDKVSWFVPWAEYAPRDYTDKNLNGKPYADSNDLKSLKFNELDGKINRKSHNGVYNLDSDGRPLNPQGRTGLKGRGVLGRWGPNHAADPLVSRVKNGKLQFVAIKRGDTGTWALPGGMVDAGEEVSETLRREFREEAMNGVLDYDKVDKLWHNGKTIYRGYVDDPRNTDNAWMETVVVNFHDSNNLLDNVNLSAGDDAKDLRWIDVDSGEPLYASHEHFIEIFKDFNAKSL